MASWFGSPNKSSDADDNKAAAKATTTRKNKPKFQVHVELDEEVLLNDFVNPKKKSKKDGSISNASSSSSPTPLLIGSMDQGTSSTRFLVFTSTTGKILCSAQMEHEQIVFGNDAAKVGWHEHDPIEIFENTRICIQAVEDKLRQCPQASYIFDVSSTSSSSATSSSDSKKTTGRPRSSSTGGKSPTLAAVGLTNQRETTLAWNKTTGIPYYNAIVWDDTRTTHIADQVAHGDVDRLRAQTGLPLASYFAGTKVKWLLDNCPALRADLADPVKQKQVAFGTIDSWLIYQLTGTPATNKQGTSSSAINVGGQHCTDVTNASRWLFMDLQSLEWQEDLIATVCHPHDAKPILQAMPKICPSSHVFTVLSSSTNRSVPDLLDQVPLAAVLGDQQAALFGQCAFEPGQAKNTYGTGLFLMMNTGTKPIASHHGLLTTVAYQMDDNSLAALSESSSSEDEEDDANKHVKVRRPSEESSTSSSSSSKKPVVYYALEGSVSHSGSTIQWLRDQLHIIHKASESETLARTTTHNDGMYLVPAFAGLFAPHWRSDARACMVGMTVTHHAGHVCRAALEAAAYQTREVLQAIQADSKVQLQQLNVDGGATHNKLLMQFQADMAQCPVVRPAVLETTALGAAYCAGLAVGVWTSLAQVQDVARKAKGAVTFTPKMPLQEREQYWKGWQKAVTKSLGWIEDGEESDEGGDEAVGANKDHRASTSSLDFQDAMQQEEDTNKYGSSSSPKGGGGDIGNGDDDSGLFSTTTLVLIAAVATVAGFLLGRGCGGGRARRYYG